MDRKCAIVTGGSSGIGRGIVYALAKNGYDVVFSYRSGKAAAEEVLHNLNDSCPEGRFAAFCCDLSVAGEGVPFFKKAVSFLGGLDLMVNNAGITIIESVFDLTEENMDHMIHLELRHYLILMREACTYMAAHGIRGSVINITSSRAQAPHPGDGVYGAIKAAINRFSQSAALDAAPYGIRINCIAPGATRRQTDAELAHYSDAAHREKIAYLSPRIPLERYGTPEDVANAVLFLSSDAGAYITGIVLTIDGGLGLPAMPETAHDAADGRWGADGGRTFAYPL